MNVVYLKFIDKLVFASVPIRQEPQNLF